MSYKDLQQIKQRIDNLIFRIKNLKSNVDLEIISDLSKYLCLLISGYFEKSICDIINSYGSKFSPQIARYIEIQFKWTTNIKMSRLLEILGQFHLVWKKEFECDPNYEVYKDVLDSIVNNRNNISHAEVSTITLSQLEDYYKIVEEILDKIRKIFKIYQSIH
ncbi:MAE_28990/MAE_18760 family HEPN-like nuclease [Treponema pectinovorum]|uniref:MAE_28990/MAE_18760 family HEPN-like nuclease n=1 Tax=Treponema pectinovorum TaxID=164 RepID=UPI0011F26F47|nr:MAE_28990/MAE_18760 family HEPN-like nuclease [Treponema pectinovorum]